MATKKPTSTKKNSAPPAAATSPEMPVNRFCVMSDWWDGSIDPSQFETLEDAKEEARLMAQQQEVTAIVYEATCYFALPPVAEFKVT